MKQPDGRVYLLVLLFLLRCAGPEGLVSNEQELINAVAAAQPGDVITLANGTYTNVEFTFTGRGTEDKPIKLVAQEKGKVFIEGLSNLSLAGEYLHVEGLVFRNGHTPSGEVISFRTDEEEVCNHCRVTECVIDNYNPSERLASDSWVSIYGKYNRFDHNYLTGKRNKGVTLAVRLTTEASRENSHRIDHNYFGHRPVLASNGGETLRIGTSTYSMSNSNTLVEANYFDRCNGELEIISNKSGGNIYRSNTFFESRGTLTMRHGNGTVVENNFFFGNGVANTGGIRVINERQTVRNNYLSGLTGYRFRSGLTVMNGVPNSPINRYFQVTDSEISNNLILNCDHVQLAAGSDDERSAVPVNTVMADNVFYHAEKENIFTVYDDISGITLKNNTIGTGMVPLREEGFTTREIELKKNDAGIELPVGMAAADSVAAGIPAMATRENCGVDWYPHREDEMYFGAGEVIAVVAGVNTLGEAIATSAPGDIIELNEGGEYRQNQAVEVNHPLTVRAASGLSSKPVLLFEEANLFRIENGGGLTLKGIHVDGRECADKPENSVIRTSASSMVNNYKLFIEDCEFTNLDVNHSFNVVRVAKNTLADSIVVRNTTFRNVSGSVLPFDQEKDDKGVYNAENVVLENCTFEDIGQAALVLYRGGSDESTFGPMLTIDDCVFSDVGHDQQNSTGTAIYLHGVQRAFVRNSTFNDCAPLKLHLVVGEPVVEITNSTFTGGSSIEDNGEPYTTKGLKILGK